MSKKKKRVVFEDETFDDLFTTNEFLKACDANDLTTIKRCLDNDMDPMCHTGDFTTGLHVAAERDFYKVGELILRNPRAKVNFRNDWGCTPLFYACAKDHIKMTLLLIKHKADVNIPDKNGTTPLHNCVRLRHNDLVNILLKNNANVNCENIYGKTPLYMAVLDNPNEQNIRRLIKHGARVDYNNGQTMPILVEGALMCQNFAMLQTLEYLITHGCDINIRDQLTGRTAFHMVAISNYVPLAEVLLDYGADFTIKDYQRKTPLNLAELHFNHDMIAFLNYWILNKE